MADIASLGVPVISDEIYHGLVYGEEEHSILEFTDNAFVLNGFSKAYAMTGWRLGYLIAPKPFIRPMQKIQQNLFISPNAFVQWAGIAALREAGPDVLRMRAIYNERRLYMLSRLREMAWAFASNLQALSTCWATLRPFPGTPTGPPLICSKRRMSGSRPASISEPTAKAICALLRQFPGKHTRGFEPHRGLPARSENS